MSRISPARSADVDASFERFVVSASPGLLRTAYLLTGDRGHAEDLLQSALMRTLRRWQAISQSPHAYTREVLINLARDGYRARGRRPRETRGDVPPELAAPDQTDGMLERDAITRAAAQLPAAQREVLACRFLLDLSVAETAALLGATQGTVKSYTARALDRLRQLLADDPVAPQPARPEVPHAD